MKLFLQIDEKEQVMNDQSPSYWKSKRVKALLQCVWEDAESGAPEGMVSVQGLYLAASLTTVIWSRLSNTYEAERWLGSRYFHVRNV
jgi:hypothetical protein